MNFKPSFEHGPPYKNILLYIGGCNLQKTKPLTKKQHNETH